MSLPTHHLCFISQWPMHTVGPLLDPVIGARSATLIHTYKELRYAQYQAKLLQLKGLTVSLQEIQHLEQMDLLREELSNLKAQHNTPLCINVTGGSQLTAIAAWEVLSEVYNHIYYIPVERDAMVWLNQDNPPHEIADVINLSDFLSANGYVGKDAFAQGEIPIKWLNMAYSLGKGEHHKQLRSLLRLMNHLPDTQDAQTSPISEKDQDGVSKLVSQLSALGMANWVNSQTKGYRKIAFSNQTSLRFIRGEWLEQLVYDLIKKNAKRCEKFQEVKISSFLSTARYHIANDDANEMVTNEMDVVVLTDNAIHLIECKTANMEDNTKAEATLAKLDTIRDMLGGIKGKAMLVTNTKLSPASKRRAKAFDVAIVDFDSMPRLESILMTWLNCK